MTDLLRVVAAIVVKDLTVEWRTRTALVSSISFAVLVLMVLYVARDTATVSALDIAPSALWVTFSFGAMVGLNRAFLLERDNRAMDAIRLTRAPLTSVFVGKLVANLAFVGLVELISLPIFVLFYDVPILNRFPELILVTVMATVAFVTVGTLLSAMVVQTRFAHMMLPVLLLPFLVTPIVGAVQMTAALLAGRPLSDVMGWLKLLAAFDIAFVAVSILLFEAALTE